MKIFHPALSLGTVLAVALLSGCATSAPKVQTHADTAVTYDNYKSFAMVYTSNLPVASNPAITPALIREIRAEMESAFVAKGLVKTQQPGADLLVYLHGGLQQKIDIQDAAFAPARFGVRGYDIDQYQEGTILIDVVDARTRALVWRGSIVGEVTDKPEPEKIKAAVGAVVARYPN
jgi:hypothetical protein